eukprot:1161809-Pelagomonas_calceolata.AAC.2
MSFMVLGGADPGKSLEAEPSCLNTTATGHGVEIGRDKLSVRYLADGRCVDLDARTCYRAQLFEECICIQTFPESR